MFYNSRAKKQMLELIQLCRSEIAKTPDFAHADWKDVDDWLFSQLDFTVGEIEEIFSGAKDTVYAASAIEGFPMRKPTAQELIALDKSVWYCVKEADMMSGKMLVVVPANVSKNATSPVFWGTILLTSGDAPKLDECYDPNAVLTPVCIEEDDDAIWFQGTSKNTKEPIILYKAEKAKVEIVDSQQWDSNGDKFWDITFASGFSCTVKEPAYSNGFQYVMCTGNGSELYYISPENGVGKISPKEIAAINAKFGLNIAY